MDVKLWVALHTQYGIKISRKIITYINKQKKITVIKTVYCTNTTSPEKLVICHKHRRIQNKQNILQKGPVSSMLLGT